MKPLNLVPVDKFCRWFGADTIDVAALFDEPAGSVNGVLSAE
jgi:hypothetical protein